jgi:hypothetical protein
VTPLDAGAAAQLLLVEETDILVDDEPALCRSCGHPPHAGACEVVVVILQGSCAPGLHYVATGICGCLGAPRPPAEEVF